MAGRLITLEGGEGAGKSTLAASLSARLEAQGRTVLRTREPGGTPGADQIRALLVSGAPDRWSALTEALLFTAARNDHLERTIRPALARGDWVVCDRYTDSTEAYQIAGGGVSAKTLSDLTSMIAAPHPDVTLVLDIAPEAGLARARSRGLGEARYEERQVAFHIRVREAFLAIAAREPHRCVVIDATLDPQALAAAAAAAIEARLGGRA